jgi:YfiH family protein
MAESTFPNLAKLSFEIDHEAGVLRSPVLDGFLWLSHGVTTRQFSPPGTDTLDLMADVRRRLLPGGARIFCGEQVHGNAVEAIDPQRHYACTERVRTRGPVVQICGVDGLIASAPALPIAVRTADCVPLLLVDVRRQRIAVVHAGWRGSMARIVEKAVAAMAGAGSDPADLVAWMGPAISRDAYEVGGDLAGKFQAAFPDYADIVEDDCLDLVLLNAFQLREAGVPAAQIHAANCCTARHPDMCYSYRAESDRAGRMVCYAMCLTPTRQEIAV